MQSSSIIKYSVATLLLGLGISAIIVTAAFFYFRNGNAPSRIAVLEKRIEVLEGEVSLLKVRDEYRSALLTNSTIRAAIKWVEEDEHPEGATLSRTEVIKLASEAAQKQGRDLAFYNEPKASFARGAKENAWWVFFEGKAPAFGNHFSVSVQDPGGVTRISGGL